MLCFPALSTISNYVRYVPLASTWLLDLDWLKTADSTNQLTEYVDGENLAVVVGDQNQ